MKKLFKKNCSLIIFSLFCLLISSCVNAMEDGNNLFSHENFSYKEVTECNPLKGFASWGEWAHEIPSSLSYIPVPLNEIVKDKGSFDFEYLEARLKVLQNNGGQAIVRIITEAPGEDNTPSYIYDSLNVSKLEYNIDGAGPYFTPDYKDQNLINYFVELIEAFGKKYDGDVRIAVIQSGLIGHWGEWHCFYCQDAMASEDQEKKVIDAFGKYFKKTRVVCRRPDAGGMKENEAIGIYNDMFYKDADDSYMDTLFDKSGLVDRWKAGMVTGEFAPELQSDFIENITQKSYLEKYSKRLDHFHNSSLLMASLYSLESSKIDSIGLKNIMHASNMMGYDFEVKEAGLNNNVLNVNIKNNGVAPFYYDWPVYIGIANANGIVKETVTDWKLTQLTSRSTVSYNAFLDVKKFTPGVYKVLLCVKNPMQNGYPVRFSNVQQDKDFEGYLTLGEISIF